MAMSRYSNQKEKLGSLFTVGDILSYYYHICVAWQGPFSLITLMAFYNRIKASMLIYDQVQSIKIILLSQNSVSLLQLLFFIGRMLFHSGI